MDIEAAGAGVGGGLFTAILAWLGFSKQQDKQDRDIEKLQESVVWRNTCAATHKGVDESLTTVKESQKRLENKMDQLLERTMK